LQQIWQLTMLYRFNGNNYGFCIPQNIKIDCLCQSIGGLNQNKMYYFRHF